MRDEGFEGQDSTVRHTKKSKIKRKKNLSNFVNRRSLQSANSFEPEIHLIIFNSTYNSLR